MTAEHPSNILYRGEARDFEHAMILLAAAAQFESLRTARKDLQTLRDLANLAARARACLSEYRRVVAPRAGGGGFEVDARNALALKWLADGDDDLRRIGEALLAGDYTALAF